MIRLSLTVVHVASLTRCRRGRFVARPRAPATAPLALGCDVACDAGPACAGSQPTRSVEQIRVLRFACAVEAVVAATRTVPERRSHPVS